MRAKSLLEAVLHASARHGSGRIVISDASKARLSYKQLFLRGFALSSALCPLLKDQKNVGIMLPSSTAAVLSIVTLQMMGRVPAMLNFSSGLGNLQHACNLAQLKTIITSRAFVTLGKFDELVEGLGKELSIIYLEDLKSRITLGAKITAALKACLPRLSLLKVTRQFHGDDVTAILYTSGSEGAPKGVALSHHNILSNIDQICHQLHLPPEERLFNPLPVFHSFGFTAGIFLPLILGMRQFHYPSPLRYKEIPPLVKETRSTIFLGADTFYQGYARYAGPEDFSTIRLAVAGAEKLKESTRLLYAEKFGVTIFQGYGVTETSPVIAVNTPEEHCPGSVGRALYGISCRLEPVEGIAEGGRLFVSGDNVMLGYIKADKPGIVQPQDDWYDTGDIVNIDSDGFLHILGRAKRFAKIGGEMVSLTAVEELAASVAPDIAHAAIAITDDKKGELIALYSESPELTREQLITAAKNAGLSELHIPRKVMHIESLPRLGTGKMDYIQLAKSSNG